MASLMDETLVILTLLLCLVNFTHRMASLQSPGIKNEIIYYIGDKLDDYKLGRLKKIVTV